MKVRRGRTHDHLVVLSAPITEELRRWHQLQRYVNSSYLFPRKGNKGRGSKELKPYLARESVEKVLLSLGYKDKHVAHGWRACFSTLAKDSGKFDRDVINLALDHIHYSEVARAYDRGRRWAQRIELAWWREQLSSAERAGTPRRALQRPRQRPAARVEGSIGRPTSASRRCCRVRRWR